MQFLITMHCFAALWHVMQLILTMLCVSFTVMLQAWGMYATLLIDLFKFLAPFLRNAELTKPAQLLYKVRD